MNAERMVRGMAGVVVLASVALAWWVNPWWLLLTAFVGLNLFQSAFTDACPALYVFRRMKS